jgi:ribosomal protein S18 acetylase RimI-like enzyme
MIFQITPTVEQVDEAITNIVRKNSKELGFVTRGAYIEGMMRNELALIQSRGEIIALCHFHIRRDRVLVIYEIATKKEHRGNGIGRALIQAIKRLGERRGASAIFLKCPEEQPANAFYKAIGFRLIGKEAGKKRRLNAWRFDLGGGFLAPKAPKKRRR